MTNDKQPAQEKFYANVSSLRDIALYLEGLKSGKGNLLPLGTIVLDDLWGVIKALNFDGKVETRPKPTFYEHTPDPLPSQPKEFQWTDSLVKEYLGEVMKGNLVFGKYETPDKSIAQFKSSHTSTAQIPKERITVSDFYFEDHTTSGYEYLFSVDVIIPDDKREKVKEAIENILNDDFVPLFTISEIRGVIQTIKDGAKGHDTRSYLNYIFHDMCHRKADKQSLSSANEEKHQPPVMDGKDWQIECFTDNQGCNYWRQKSGGYHNLPFTKDIDEFHFLDHPEVYKITFVKRLSDGVVFTIGDEVGVKQKHNYKISAFLIKPDDIMADLSGNGCVFLQYLTQKLPSPPKEKEPEKDNTVLFTTSDGKQIIEGDRFWVVDTDWSLFEAEPAHRMSGLYSERKYFSTPESANEYVLMNKPCLSLIEVLDAKNTIANDAKGHDTKNYLNDKFREIAQSKTIITN